MEAREVGEELERKGGKELRRKVVEARESGVEGGREGGLDRGRRGVKRGRRGVKRKLAMVEVEPACEYERVRAANIAERRALFLQLGIQQHVTEAKQI